MSLKVKIISIASTIVTLLSVIVIAATTGSKSYTVSFDHGDKITTQEVKEGDCATKPLDPIKDNHVFEYWMLDDIEYDFNIVVTSDITLTAVYDVEEYTVSFISDNETLYTQVIKYNETVRRPDSPTKDGYVFKYWELNDAQFDFDTKVTQNLEINASWINRDLITNYYIVTFSTGYETFNVSVAEGTIISIPENPVSESQDFLFWMNDLIEFNFDTIISSDITLEAKWSVKKFTLTFDTDGGTTLPTIVVEVGSLLNVDTPIKTNHTFLYWTVDGEYFDLTTPVTSDLHLVAVWSKEYYTITFMSSGTQVSPQNVKYNELITKPTDPTHNEANFLYWSYNNEEFDFNTKVTTDILLIAVFSDVEYTITFMVDSDVYDTLSILSTQLVVPPLKPTKENYEFLYWSYNDEQFEFYQTTNKNITLIAVFEEISNESVYYTITFTTNGGTLVSSQNIISGGIVDKPDDPERDYYHFMYWTLNNIEYNFNSKVVENITLVAVWKIYSYNVTFDSDGGSYAATQVIDMYQRASSPTVLKTNHTFLYWSLDGVEFKFTTTITSDITLVAVWEEIIYCTVSYNSSGGTSVDQQVVVSGSKAAYPYDPIKVNYTFAYWSYDGVQFDFNTLITSDITLVAVWVSSLVYVVTFDSDGGSLIDSQLIEGNQTVAYPGVPAKDGYLFMGWTLNDEDYSFGFTVNSNITITAKWVLIPVVSYYTVVFVSNSSIVSERTVQANTATTTLSITQTSTHKLSGWEYNGEVFSFTTLITQDITLYAIWEERIFYTITYDFDGGTSTGTTFPTSIEKGYSTGYISAVTKNFNTFSYWALPDGTKFTFNTYNSSSITGDIHVKAIWLQTELSITYVDKTVNYTGYNQSLTVSGTIPTGVSMVYTNVDTLANISYYSEVGVYVIRADAYSDGAIVWSATATLTINAITLTISSSGDYEYEYTGSIITPNVTVSGSGYGSGNTTTSSRGTLTITYDREILNVGVYTATVTLIKSGVENANYILANNTFTIEVIAIRQYNFEYEVNNNQVTITGFFNTIQTDLTVPSTIDGKSVVAIADSAFRDMKYLTNVSLPNTITYLGTYAFYGCTALTTVSLGSGITNISDYAFSGCTSLTTVTFGNNVETIGNYSFNGCTKLNSITQSSNLVSIGNYSFYNNDALTYLPFADSIETIGAHAFRNSDGLTSIILPEGLKSIATYAFSSCIKLVNVSFPSTLTSIDTYAFSECYLLTSAILPEGLTTLGSYAFYRCSVLTTVVIPSTLEVINTYAFDLCYKLESLTFNNNSNLKSIGNYAFRNSALITLSLPNGLTTIGNYAFSGITELTTVVLPDSVVSCGTYIFSGCTGLTSYTLSTGLTTIPNYIFNGCTGLTTINIPSYFTAIGDGAFASVSNATSINFLSTNTLLTIGVSAFNGVKLVTGINIPISVTTIGNYAFNSMTSLSSFTIPANVKTLGSYVFSGCTSLTNGVIPSTVTSIGSNLFSGCTSLVSATINAPITTLPQYTFNGCFALTTVSLPTTLTIIDSYAFRYCTAMASYSIPSTVYRINAYAFEYCSGLTSVTIHENVTLIYSNAFRYCTKINIFINLESQPTTWSSSWASNIGTSNDDTTGNIIYLKA